MAFVRDWEKEIEDLSDNALAKISEALHTLDGWTMFKKEYHGMGLTAICAIIEAEIEERKEG